MPPTASTNPPKTFRWPGSANLHTVSWADQKAAVAARRPAAAPAAPAPAAPAPSAVPAGPQAAPPDAAYQAGMLGAQQGLTNTVSGLQQQRTGQLIGFGYSEDPVSGALTFNPNDPFSKASLLKKNYDTSRARTAQSMGSTGGLYAGSFQNAQDLVNRGQLQDENALQSSLTSWLAQNKINEATAGSNYLDRISGLEGERVARIPDNPLYSPTALDPALGAAAGAGGAVAPPKGGIGKPASKTNPNTLLAAPGAPKVKTKTKGKVKTYTRAVNRA